LRAAIPKWPGTLNKGIPVFLVYKTMKPKLGVQPLPDRERVFHVAGKVSFELGLDLFDVE
jgi:hypothetical protein